MKREILKDRVLTMMMDEERPLVRGRFYQGAIMVKHDDRNVVFTATPATERIPIAKNPVFYQGSFISSRIKKNGDYSIHAVVKDCTDYAKSREQAHLEIYKLDYVPGFL